MKSVCCVSVLLLWAVFSGSEAQADLRTVKLCGREFIRAVVYTCGGSRWRRFSRIQYDDGLMMFNSARFNCISELVSSNLQPNNICTNEFPIKVLSQAHVCQEPSPDSNRCLSNGAVSSVEDSLSEGPELSRRDINSICCQYGCQKSDLTLLC